MLTAITDLKSITIDIQLNWYVKEHNIFEF